jgi:hypothetical protein
MTIPNSICFDVAAWRAGSSYTSHGVHTLGVDKAVKDFLNKE